MILVTFVTLATALVLAISPSLSPLRAEATAAEIETALLTRIALSSRQPNQISLSTLQLPEGEFLRSALAGKSTHEAALNSNPCFLALADKFYREIREMDVSSALETGQEIPRPSATDSLTSSPITKAPNPGWLWQKALTTAQGDNGLAMELLSICAARASDLDWPSQAKMPLSGTTLSQWTQLLAAKGLEPSKIDSLLATLRGYVETPSCPRKSSWMYWPQSLDKEVEYTFKNLPQPAQRQAHYEDVIRNSWLACGLYRKGRATPFIQDLLIRFATIEARASRCQGIGHLLSQAEALKWTEMDWTSASMQSFVKTITETPDICVSTSSFSPELKEIAPVACQLMKDVLSEDFLSLSLEQRSESWRHRAAEIDAALFIAKNPAWIKSQPCLAQKSSSDWRSFISTVMYRKCPSHFSLARCARLMQILDSWGRELVVAEDQIRNAVDFASDHCAISSEDAKSNACRIRN